MESRITSNRMSAGTDKLLADKSIDDAKWLLGAVAAIGTLVFATGVAAAIIS